MYNSNISYYNQIIVNFPTSIIGMIMKKNKKDFFEAESYKKEDVHYKNFLIRRFGSDEFIDKSLDKTIDSEDGEYVMQVIREEYLRDSTVTIFIIGTHSSENEGTDYYGDKNFFIKRELRASLHNGKGNT